MILRRHGCSVLGDSVEMALRRALNLEEAARLTYRALAAGPRRRPHRPRTTHLRLTLAAAWHEPIRNREARVAGPHLA